MKTTIERMMANAFFGSAYGMIGALLAMCISAMNDSGVQAADIRLAFFTAFVFGLLAQKWISAIFKDFAQ